MYVCARLCICISFFIIYIQNCPIYEIIKIKVDLYYDQQTNIMIISIQLNRGASHAHAFATILDLFFDLLHPFCFERIRISADG